MDAFENLKPFKLTDSSVKLITGGVTREEYCETNAMIMQSCYNKGDLDCMAAGGAAWEEHCEPYGL